MVQPAPTEGEHGRAPRFTTCLPKAVDARLRDAAARKGTTPSLVVREALEQYLADLEGTAPPGRKSAA